jgi:trimethylamine:corrinoid methyltransferase-like protein
MLSYAAMGMGVGAVTNGTAVSAEAMVMDADFIRCARRLAAGIETGHLEQASREIMEVGHGGNFMMAEATLALMRDEAEYFIPPTFNRAGTAAPAILERAHERVEQITSGWRSPVPEAIVERLQRLLS